MLLCFAAALRFDNLLQIAPCIALITAFCVIARGADMFRLFSLPTSQARRTCLRNLFDPRHRSVFGDRFVIGKDVAADMSVPMYGVFAAVLALVTRALSGMPYHYVEKPEIALGKRLGKRSE